MIARPQLAGADDRVDRADLDGALDAVHAVELGGHLAELLGPHGRAHLGQLGGELRRARRRVASPTRASQVGRPGGRAAVRASTSRAKTTAAAGAPPMTEANEPSTASTVMRGLSALENTTNAPPW